MLDSHRNTILACALSALAGYVDAIGFLHLNGMYVAFMSGNSTRLGVSLAAISRRYFNTLRWISTLPPWAPLPSLI